MNQLTNNQLNKVIGQRWTDLPDSDRQYYLDKAVRDKERYAEVSLYFISHFSFIRLKYIFSRNWHCTMPKNL